MKLCKNSICVIFFIAALTGIKDTIVAVDSDQASETILSELQSIAYIDPFDFVITPAVPDSTFPAIQSTEWEFEFSRNVPDAEVVTLPTGQQIVFLRPLVRIPYKPVLRSPYQP